ncbi:hypothetical protein cypCar_00018614 [Cyprinus carpio]|nr:hypothetical protein cypCar_00018614 [Cyprinus carpio]
MKNRALIVSVEDFYPGVDLDNRKGAKRDTQRLHKTLSKLGFSVEIRIDIEADAIYKAFKEESKKTVKDCFVGVISSHGTRAFMHPAGSEFDSNLCNLLEEEGGPDLEITRLLTRINFQVAYNLIERENLGGKKQMPSFVTRLQERFSRSGRWQQEEDLSLTFAGHTAYR